MTTLVRRGGIPSAHVRAVAAMVAVITAAVSCTGADEQDRVSPSASPVAAVRLVSTGGDVFAWHQSLEGIGECDTVAAVLDGQEVDGPAQIADGGFSVTVPVRTGEQRVAVRCVLADGDEVETEPIVLTGKLRPRPTARITVRIEGSKVVLDGARSEPTRPDGSRIVAYRWEPVTQIGRRPDEPPLTLADGSRFRRSTGGRRLALASPSEDGEYFVSLTVEDAEGRTDTSTTYFVVEDGRPRTVDLMREHPAWIDSAIVYAPVHELWGGGADAVEERLPYLKELGVDALWLWPPVTRRALGQTYAISDYFTLDEEWGTRTEFRRMVDRAHELGIRVLLDFVPNHTSIEHRYFRRAERDGPGSHYWDFYDRRPDGTFTHYFDWDDLPNLNFDEPQVRTMITEAFSYWIREFDVDGFRVDVAWGIERRRPGYWAGWRRELKRIEPDLLLLAEATARDPYYFENGFDVAYDWTMRPGQWPWANVWEFPQEIQPLLRPSLRHRYPADARILRFLNNNDTGIRFEELHGAPFTRVASALQFTVPGVPLLFAGDEIGASYQPYGILERIQWRDTGRLRPWYRKLIGLRTSQPALRSSRIQVLSTDRGSVVSYVRPAAEGGGPVLVVLNFAEETVATIRRDRALDPLRGAGVLEDAMTGERLTVRPGDDLTLPMAGFEVRILVPAGGSP